MPGPWFSGFALSKGVLDPSVFEGMVGDNDQAPPWLQESLSPVDADDHVSVTRRAPALLMDFTLQGERLGGFPMNFLRQQQASGLSS